MNIQVVLFFSILSISNIELIGMYNESNTFLENASKSSSNNMCSQVSYFLQLFTGLKSQSFDKIPAEYVQLQKTQNDMINGNIKELNVYNRACAQNKADSHVKKWKFQQFLIEHSFEEAKVITALLHQKNK